MEEEKAIKAIKKNNKFFYSYAKKKSKTKVTIGPFMDNNNRVINDPHTMGDMLKTQYKSVQSKPKSEKIVSDPISFFKTDNDFTLNDINFNQNDVKKAMLEVSATAAPRPDYFPALVLNKCADTLSTPIYIIWRKSLDLGKIPSLTKDALVSPIHKGDSRALPKNYGPISLTSHIIKVFERIIRKQLVDHLEDNNIMNPNQHGFRSGQSCLSQLLAQYDLVLRQMEEGKNIDVIYLDFAKAFDKVDHGILIHKLRDIGISGKLGIWLNDFLTDRSQSVVINGTTTEPFEVMSGVPQGTVLGPILFLIYVLDIDAEMVESSVSSFADDTRVSKGIISLQDITALQKDLDSIYNWASVNNMMFNDTKFELLRYGENKFLKESTNYLGPSGKEIEEHEHVRDLGVVMSSDASFTAHIHQVAATARKYAGWVLRTFNTRERTPLLTLWKSLIIPRLDYCSQLWCPHKASEIQLLENIQRSFTAKVNGMSNLNYWERLQFLQLYSLERRRERYLVIYTWKTLEGLVPNNCNLISTETRRHGRKCIVIPSSATVAITANLINNSFTTRGPKLFNCLPVPLRNLSGVSVTTFKKHFDKFLKTIPDEPGVSGYVKYRAATTNSLVDQVAYFNQQSWHASVSQKMDILPAEGLEN